jgi:hypothetical protein
MQIGVQLNGKLLINAADELLLFGFGREQLIQSIEQNDLNVESSVRVIGAAVPHDINDTFDDFLVVTSGKSVDESELAVVDKLLAGVLCGLVGGAGKIFNKRATDVHEVSDMKIGDPKNRSVRKVDFVKGGKKNQLHIAPEIEL